MAIYAEPGSPTGHLCLVPGLQCRKNRPSAQPPIPPQSVSVLSWRKDTGTHAPSQDEQLSRGRAAWRRAAERRTLVDYRGGS